MLKIFKIIVYASSFIINIATRIFRIKKNRITFISYFMDQPEDNFKIIASALEKEGHYELIFLLKKYHKNLSGKYLYFINMLKQAYYFNTSKIIILDGNSIVMKTIIKKKKTIVLQIWHACGALKKFGADVEDRLYKIRSCDYVITNCNKVVPIYSHALNVPMDHVLGLGSPRTDKLFSESETKAARDRIFIEHRLPSEKKMLLYAPTFRGTGIDEVYSLEIDLNLLANQLKDDYILALRLHPMISDYQKPAGVIDLSNIELTDALSAADMLITDYSSIIFDYSILERPMVFYCPDLDYYKSKRGFYVDFDEFIPGPVTKNLEDLIVSVNELKFSIDKAKKIKQEYFDNNQGIATNQIISFIKELYNG